MMQPSRIHLTGGSGAGVTSLGRALAGCSGRPHFDTDDLFWLPTDPPYRSKRAAADRVRLANELFAPRPDWILSGSLDGWGDPLVPLFDLVVFLHAPAAVRLERLRAREARRYGPDAIAPGGWHHRDTEEFIEWASHYDDGREGRSRARHEAWLAKLRCPVLRLSSTAPIDVLVEQVVREVRV